MTRRSIFKSLVACVAASAMEVCGWKMPKPLPAPYSAEWKYMYAYDPAFKGGDNGVFIWGRFSKDGHVEILNTDMPRWNWTGTKWERQS